MVSQAELARKFARGQSVDSLPNASNIAAQEGPDGVDYLVGYGHAIYAARFKGSVLLFEGWRGYSVSTTCQLTELKKGFSLIGPYLVDDEERPRTRVGERVDAEGFETVAAGATSRPNRRTIA